MPRLSPEHHRELNVPPENFPGGEKARNKRIEELRKQYANDPVALQQIDPYSKGSEYLKSIVLLRKALKRGDQKTVDKIVAWGNEHYPDIK